MARRLALALILLLAGALRFTGLGWGLRHPPFNDERSFVDATAAMLAHGDLDHRFYEYPGLFIYALAPLFAALAPDERAGPPAYLVARGLVAAFGLASVVLVYLLGRRLVGVRAGLVAALLLAVSPLDVSTAHMVRPDVALGAAVLAAMLAFDRLGERTRDDAWAGAALGVAAATKFTGALLVPSYLLRRWLTPGPRLRGTLWAGLAAATVFVVTTPYSLLRAPEFLGGVEYQLVAHYRGRQAPGYLDTAAFYLGTAAEGLGTAGAGLAVLGAGLALRDRRRWLPLLTFPILIVAVMSTAEVRYPRHVVPASGILALLAAVGVEALARRHVVAGAVAALVAVPQPLAASAHYARKSARPGPRDVALDWIAAQVRPGGRILNVCRDLSLGLDRTRYEVLDLRPKTARLGLLAPEVDLVVSYPDVAARLPGLDTALHLRADRGEAPFKLLVPRPQARPRYVRASLAEARLAASSGATELEALRDGDGATAWAAGEPSGGEPDWIEVAWRQPVRLGRLELVLGRPPRPCVGRLEAWVPGGDRGWERVPGISARPEVPAQLGRPSQVLVLGAVTAPSLRLTCSGRGIRPWQVAELGVESRTASP